MRRQLTRGWSGPARDQFITAEPRWAPAAQPLVVSWTMDYRKLRVALLAVAFVFVIVLHFHAGFSLGVSLLIVLVGWPLGGTLITIDDDLPGGWSNPNGTVRPAWLEAPFWGQIVGGLAFSSFGFAVDAGVRSLDGLRFLVLALAAGFLSAALFTRRWWLLSGVLLGLPAVWK